MSYIAYQDPWGDPNILEWFYVAAPVYPDKLEAKIGRTVDPRKRNGDHSCPDSSDWACTAWRIQTISTETGAEDDWETAMKQRFAPMIYTRQCGPTEVLDIDACLSEQGLAHLLMPRERPVKEICLIVSVLVELHYIRQAYLSHQTKFGERRQMQCHGGREDYVGVCPPDPFEVSPCMWTRFLSVVRHGRGPFWNELDGKYDECLSGIQHLNKRTRIFVPYKYRPDFQLYEKRIPFIDNRPVEIPIEVFGAKPAPRRITQKG